MGIETIIALGVAAAAAGGSAQQAHAQSVHAGQDKRDAETQNALMVEKANRADQQNLADKANAAVQARERALRASTSSYQTGVETNPLGDVGAANTANKTLLGL